MSATLPHQCPSGPVYQKIDFEDIDDSKLEENSPSFHLEASYVVRWQDRLIRHFCHKCHNKDIREVFETVKYFDLNLAWTGVISQILANLRLNEKQLDWELVRMAVKLIKKFLEDRSLLWERCRLVFKLELVPVARMLLGQYFANEQAEADQDGSLAKLVLDLVWNVFHANRTCRPDDQLKEDLIKSFPFHPRKVFSIVCFLMESINDYEEYCKFWDEFAAGVHEAHREKWQSDEELALTYAMVLTNFEEVFQTKGNYRLGEHYMSQWLQSATSLIEVLRQVDIIPTRKMLLFLVQNGGPSTVTEDLITMLSEKISWILASQPVNLHHVPRQIVTGSSWESFKTKMADLLQQSVTLSFLDTFVEDIAERIFSCVKYNLNFINILIKLATYDHLNLKTAYTALLRDIIQTISHMYQNDMDLVKSGIPQTIYAVINNLHESCMLCADKMVLMRELRQSIKPDAFEVIKELRLRKSVELAVTLPYAIRDKFTLIRMMHADGFYLLTKQLEQGKDVESLYAFAQVLWSPPDDTWRIVPCGINIPTPHHYDETRVIVLDDGTRIRAKTLPLVENSHFFYSLFTGGFAEASLEEVRLCEVTVFQLCFILRFVETKPEGFKIAYDLDVETHLELIIVCDKLLLQSLRDTIVDSLRWHHMTSELCWTIFNTSLFYGIESLGMACLHFALFGDYRNLPKMESLQNLFLHVDKKAIAGHLRRWFKKECKSYPELEPVPEWYGEDVIELAKLLNIYCFNGELGKDLF